MAGRGGTAGRSRGPRPFGAPPREAPADAAERGPEADHEAVARKILLDQLTGQARSRAELATKLAKKIRWRGDRTDEFVGGTHGRDLTSTGEFALDAKGRVLAYRVRSVGGTGDPAAAPEAEQDRRAAALLARAGSNPWPDCGG